MDEKSEAKLMEKDKEIENLKNEIAELQKNREAIIRVLQTAEEKAKEIVSDARKEAEDIRSRAEEEIREKKELVNREIDIKRKAVKSYYINENKKIDQIRGEVERMRETSLDAIRRLEIELRQVERLAENSRAYTNTAMNYAESGSSLEIFDDALRDIPVHIVEPLAD